MKQNTAQKVAIRGLLIATAFVLSYLEAQIPYPFPIPGIKLGLTNLAVLIAFYKLSNADAFFINIVRIILVSITFAGMSSLMYSLAGGMLSFIVMFIIKSFTKSSTQMVSILGGIAHNIGQVITAIIILENVKIIWYLPYLMISGVISGLIIGLLCDQVVKKLRI